MLLDRTIAQLDIGDVSPDRAQELGQLGYMQWIGALPARSDYRTQAMRAFARASEFAGASPAVAVFCDLILASVDAPLTPLPMKLPDRQRRGGSLARRMAG